MKDILAVEPHLGNYFLNFPEGLTPPCFMSGHSLAHCGHDPSDGKRYLTSFRELKPKNTTPRPDGHL